MKTELATVTIETVTTTAETVTATAEVITTTESIQTAVLSIDKNTVIKKQATANIKIEKENTLIYIRKLLATPTAEIEANNPLFAGTNILYLYLNSKLVHLDFEDKGTEKVVNLLLWVVSKSGINPFRFIESYKDLEILKKYYANFAITDETNKTGLQAQLNEIIKFDVFITNYLNDKSETPTPSFLRKSDELKPLFVELRGNSAKLKDFNYLQIVQYNTIIASLRTANA